MTSLEQNVDSTVLASADVTVVVSDDVFASHSSLRMELLQYRHTASTSF